VTDREDEPGIASGNLSVYIGDRKVGEVPRPIVKPSPESRAEAAAMLARE